MHMHTLTIDVAGACRKHPQSMKDERTKHAILKRIARADAHGIAREELIAHQITVDE